MGRSTGSGVNRVSPRPERLYGFRCRPAAERPVGGVLRDNRGSEIGAGRNLQVNNNEASAIRGGLLIAATALLAGCGSDSGIPEGRNWEDVAHGEGIYKAECAQCHGANLEGQPDWRVRRPDGKLPAPPHDASGHTWHHPMEQLFAIIKFGMVPPNAPAGYVSDMPAYGTKLSTAQIHAVLAYIESRWPPEVIAERKKRFAAAADEGGVKY